MYLAIGTATRHRQWTLIIFALAALLAQLVRGAVGVVEGGGEQRAVLLAQLAPKEIPTKGGGPTILWAPEPKPDSYTTPKNTVLNVPAPGVLANDYDYDNDILTAVSPSEPASGSVTLNKNGSFVYTPDPNFIGTDSFTYGCYDGSHSPQRTTVTITVTDVNRAPVAVDDQYTTPANTTLTVPAPGVLANDTDPDGDPLTATSLIQPNHGSVTLNASGSFTYQPDTGFSGADIFSYKAKDGKVRSTYAKVRITVTPANDAPHAAADSYSTAEDTTLTIAAPGVLANDSDPDGNPLTAVSATQPQHGSVTLNTNGSFSYTPAANYSGSDSFSYRASDGTLTSAPATVNITVTPANDAPMAVADTYSTAEDTTLTIAAPGVLANDSDPDGNPLTAVSATQPQHGTVTLNANGSFSYTPASNYSGSDSFSYRASDGTLTSAPATVNITVTPANDAPHAAADSYSTAEDTTLTIAAPGVLANDSDPDGNPLTATSLIQPNHGSVTLNANGSFSYTPASNYSGPDSFTYRASDGTLASAPATVTVTVTPANDAPVAVADSYTIAEDTTLTIAAPGVLANDSDPDGNPLTAVSATQPQHGTVTLNANGSFSYTPASNYSGSDSFTYRASDGTLTSAPATVTVTVTPANDAPVAVADSYTIAEDTTLTIAAPGVLANDSDPDGNPLTAVSATQPQHGTVTLNANGSFSYTPAANYSGSDSFTYRASDGTLTSAPATVSITVTPVNDAPIATGDSYSTLEDVPLIVDAPGVLANDTDANGDTLTALLLVPAQHGTVTLNANGSFSYTPVAGYHGTDSFSYRARDAALFSAPATVNIVVVPVNDAPVARPDSYTTAEDVALVVAVPGVLANDTDEEGDAMTAALVSQPQHGTLALIANGSFTYTPAANYSGPDSFSYRASDGTLTSAPATVSITVTPVTDVPRANPDSYTTLEDVALVVTAPGVLANDTDDDGDILSAALVTQPQRGTVSLRADGSFTYTPAAHYHGPDSFSYRAVDGTQFSAPAVVSIVVTPVNDPPVAQPDTYLTTEEVPRIVNAPGVLANDTDADGNALTTVLAAQPENGLVTLNANGSFTYTPAANFSGIDAFSYRANDGTTSSAPATVSILVSPVADAPVAQPDSYTTVEDVALVIGAPGVLGNDTDDDGDALTTALVSQPLHGALTLNPNGSFTYTPVADFHGTDSFSYLAFDGAQFSAPAVVIIDVVPANDAPVAQPDSYTTAEDVTLVVNAPGVLANDVDVDGDSLTVIVVSAAQHGSVSLNANGSFTYAPERGYHGPDSFRYRANDGLNDSAPALVSIVVTPVADAPVASPDSFITAEDVPLVVNAPGVLVNDTDEDGSTLTAIIGSVPLHGSVTLNANGSFRYVPAAGFNGVDTFSYRASDGTSPSAPALVTIVVTPVADAPVANPDSYGTPQNVTLVVAVPGVLGNDTDEDGDALAAALVGQPQHGALTLNANGSFTYAPAQGFVGTDSFTYRASDGVANSAPALVTIAVSPPSNGPTARPDNFTVAEDTTLNIAASGVLTNDTDDNGEPLTAVLESQPPHGSVGLNANGSFAYQPDPDYHGFDTFAYRASDGTTLSAPTLVTIEVTPVADPPVANPDQYATVEDVTLAIAAPGVLQNDTDEDGDPLTAVLVAAPLHGAVTLNPNGSFSYVPAAGFNGGDSFTYRASDGTASSAVALVSIQVAPVADPPVAAPDGFTTTEDVPLLVAAPGVLANDSDQDGDALIAVLAMPPQNGDVSLNQNGSFLYSPAVGFHGTDSFTYRAFDGTAVSTQGLVTIVVTPLDDQLVARPDRYTTPEDVVLNVAAPGVLANDSNEDGGPLSAILEDLPLHGTVMLFSNGRFSYRPDTNFFGADRFTYRAVDGAVSSAPVLVSIDVTPVVDAPSAVPDFYLTPFETPLSVAAPGVLANDRDPESDPLTAELVSPPAHGTVTLLANGSFTYTPDVGFIGQDSFIYLARDGLAVSSAATVSIAVGVPDSDPDTLADSYGAVEDFPLAITAPGVLLNDATGFGPNLLASLVGQPRHGAVSLSADGSYTYVPAANYFGSDSFQYRASDGLVSLGPVTVEINVLPVNDAPGFARGPDQLVQMNAGAIAIPGWAGNISSGPANEADQAVGFIVSSDNPSLFSAPPAVAANGTLTFASAPNAYGVAQVTVIARDTGGTDYGGRNSSAPAVFAIRVNSPPPVQVVSPEGGNIYFPHQAIPFVATASDPDGIVTNATLLIDGSPIASFANPPYARSVSNLTAAAHVLTASARDDLGATGVSAPVGLTVIPRPPVTPLKQGFNFQVGLVEQTIRVDNPTPYPITAVRVLVSGLQPNVRIFNASGTNQLGVPYVLHNREVPARSSVLLTVEYLTPLVQTIQSTLVGEIVPIAPPPAAATGELINIERMSKFPDGRVLLTFNSIAGRLYWIEYSEDLENWKTAHPGVTAVGEGIQWVDNGWPKTEGHPAGFSERFYRIRLAPLTAP